MNELEKKFYEYFMSEYFNPKEPEKIAKDLAEIAQKEHKQMINAFKTQYEIMLELREEIAELKEELKSRIAYDLKAYNDLVSGYKKQREKIIELEKQIEDNK